jgi:hypothetical protein
MKIYVDGQYIESDKATPSQKKKIAQQRPLLFQEVFYNSLPTEPRAAKYDKFQVYQVYFDKDSRKRLDRGFIPYDNSGNTHNFENDVILDLWLSKRKEWIDKRYVGVLSWRFQEKAMMTSQETYKRILHSKADVINLSPKMYVGLKHPYVREGYRMVTDICKMADEYRLFPFDLYQYPVNEVIFCNYWLATPQAFELYCQKYLSRCIMFFRDNKNEEIARMYQVTENHREGKPYIAFTFFLEGLFSVFIKEEKLKILTL